MAREKARARGIDIARATNRDRDRYQAGDTDGDRDGDKDGDEDGDRDMDIDTIQTKRSFLLALEMCFSGWRAKGVSGFKGPVSSLCIHGSTILSQCTTRVM